MKRRAAQTLPVKAIVNDEEKALLWYPVLPPTGNHAWRMIVMGRAPRIVLTATAREWMADFAVTWSSLHLPVFDRRWIVLDTWWTMPDRRIRDVHNLLKVLCDGMQKAGVVENDMRILERTQAVRIVGDQPPDTWPCESLGGWTATPDAIDGSRLSSEGVLIRVSPAFSTWYPEPRE